MKRAWWVGSMVAGLVLALGCGDDDGVASDLGPPGDMGAMTTDDAAPPADLGGEQDLGGEPLCDAATCVNGACEADICVCDAGWTGDTCADLDEPTETNLLLWFDGDAMETLTIGDGMQIDAWEARYAVGGGAMVTPPSDGQRPRFQPGTSTWGRGAVGFDGVDDMLVQDGLWPGLAGRTEYTLAVVYTTSTTDTTAFVMTDPDGDPGFGIGTGSLPRQVLAIATDGTGGGTVLFQSEENALPTSGIQIAILRVSSGGSGLYLNGELVDRQLSVPTLALPASDIVLGADRIDGPSRIYGGAIGEVLVFGEALSEERFMALEDYLEAKWQSL